MISVNTPKVPSEPTKSPVRWYPAEDFIAIPPVRITVPSASTTSAPRTWSRITPYLTAFVPLALMPAIPPSEASQPGSTGKRRPCSANATFSAPWVRPGWTRAMKSSDLTFRMRSILPKSRLMPPCTGRVRLKAASLPERHEGYQVLVGEAQDPYDLIAALWVDHSVRMDRGVVGEDAAPVPFQVVSTGDDAVLWQDGTESREQVHFLVRLDGVGQGSEALYLDRDLISCLQPHLRIAGHADAWWRACNYDVARDEGHALGEEGYQFGDREDHLLSRPVLHDLAVQDAAYGEVLGVFDLVCGRDERP